MSGMRRPDVRMLWGTVAAGAAVAVGLIAAPFLAALVERAASAPAPRAIAQAGCTPPSEFEQLHIVVVARGAQFHADCLYIGSRGTYRRSVR